MRVSKRIALAVVAVLAMTLSANAQFKMGIKAGMNVTEMSFDEKMFDSSNCTGYNAGLTAEINIPIPIFSFGFDLSVMYVHRVNEANAGESLESVVTNIFNDKNYREKDYIEIPLNIKKKFEIPVVEKFITPYIFTGPSVSFLCSKKALDNAWKNKSVNWAWNVGVGLELFKHLQVGASYGFGMNKAMEYVGPADLTPADDINGKTDYWTITAAWLF